LEIAVARLFYKSNAHHPTNSVEALKTEHKVKLITNKYTTDNSHCGTSLERSACGRYLVDHSASFQVTAQDSPSSFNGAFLTYDVAPAAMTT